MGPLPAVRLRGWGPDDGVRETFARRGLDVDPHPVALTDEFVGDAGKATQRRGEVFRATDPRLGRDVAIKALPPAFSRDPDRLARFEREARLLASLSHTNIAGIHGIEEVDDGRYLVLEFVPGETLAARLTRGPLPPDEAIEIAKQIAAGVEGPHYGTSQPSE